MIISKKGKIDLHLPDEIKANLAIDMKKQLFADLFDYVDPENYYCIRYTETAEPSDYGCQDLRMYLDVNLVAEKIVQIKKPEERYLIPQKHLIDKLKCCVKYLRDKRNI